MKNIKKYIVLIILLNLLLLGSANAYTYYKGYSGVLKNSTNATNISGTSNNNIINKHGTAQIVNITGSIQYFIPTESSTEWSSFRTWCTISSICSLKTVAWYLDGGSVKGTNFPMTLN